MELADHTRNDTETAARMDLLREKAEATQKASYRMEVRQGVIVRMRFTLIGIAGRVHLARQAAASQRQAYEALVACEEFTLTRSQELPASSLDTEPFPSYKEELKLAEAALPWLDGHPIQGGQPGPPRHVVAADRGRLGDRSL